MDPSMKVCGHCFVNNDPANSICWQCEQPLADRVSDLGTGTLKMTEAERAKVVQQMLGHAVIAEGSAPSARRLRLPDLRMKVDMKSVSSWLHANLPHGGGGRMAGSH